jgi:molybdopterin molybdotransferase
MTEFLKLSLPAEALAKLFANLSPPEIQPEEVETADGLGRITYGPLSSPQDLPEYQRSTVDGYAVRAADTFGASEGLPAFLKVAGEVKMGATPGFALEIGTAGLIHTGGMLPGGADAVVMVEQTRLARPGEIEVYRATAAGENVIQKGEDIGRGDVVVEEGVRIGAAEVGGLMALGITRFTAAARPAIGIISSGDEVIPPLRQPTGSQVRDINSYSLSAFVEECGGRAVRMGIAGDNLDELKKMMQAAMQTCQVVVITAGSSASVRDLTAEAINSLGRPGVLVHGVNVKPGKPTILGVCAGKVMIGLPGNPVSALVIARKFLKPVISYYLGFKEKEFVPTIRARLATNIPSQAGREDWVPVKLEKDGDSTIADPIFYKSNLIFSLVRADGLLHIVADQTGLSSGEAVEIELLD